MEAVVAKPIDPVPCNNKELLAKLAVPVKLPEVMVRLPEFMVILPINVVLPVTVREPDMTGWYMFI